MKLIIGLGNPGEKYAKTRHNLGFVLVDQMAAMQKLKWKAFKDGELAEIPGPEKVFLYKPLNFMNNSGIQVRTVVDYYQVPMDQLVVVCDDVYLAPGSVRIRQGGGDGGHNGLKSLLQHLPDHNFWRVRLGAGIYGQTEGEKLHLPPLEDYVLLPVQPKEQGAVQQIIDRLAQDLLEWAKTNSPLVHLTDKVEETN